MVGDDGVVDEQAAGQEEAGADGAVEEQEDTGGQEDRKPEEAEDGGDEPSPAGERHAHEGHALAAEVDQGGDEVDRAHQRGAAEDSDAEDPEVLAHTFTGSGDGAGAGERRVGGPTGERRATLYEEGSDHD